MLPKHTLLPLLGLLAAPAVALAQIQVVGDDACPKYAVDIAAFATCDGDKVAQPAPVSTLRIAALPQAQVPAVKQSAIGLHVNAAEASRMKNEHVGQVVLIDIRSRAEVAFAGQPDVVDIHVPYMEPVLPLQWNPATNSLRMQRNPAFVEQVKTELARHEWPEDSTVLLLCRAGERSAIAADALAAAGLTRVYTIVDGFEGDLGARGRRDVNGWKNAGGRWQSQPLARLTSATDN
jgi:rhodanese-related sulfurtransferase